MIRFTLFPLIALLALAGPAAAVEPDEILSDPVLEERARALSKDLRCVVCQNQSIDDSDADLAKDLRVIVRERLTAGDNDEEVIQYLVDRYGDYVLLKTPVKAETLPMWLAPFAVLIIAILSVAYWYRSKIRQVKQDQGNGPKGLSAEEKARLEALLKEEE